MLSNLPIVNKFIKIMTLLDGLTNGSIGIAAWKSAPSPRSCPAAQAAQNRAAKKRPAAARGFYRVNQSGK
jgi:hypothetical protein